MEQKNKDLYSATIKLEDPDRLQALWSRNWGCDNDVGQIRAVLMHRPGEEFAVIDRSKQIVNGLAVRPGRVIMPKCISDTTRKALEDHGVEIIELSRENFLDLHEADPGIY